MPRKIAFTILAIACIAGAIIIAIFAYRASVANAMELQVVPPERVLIGIPFDVKVGVANKSSKPLKNVRVSLNLPPGVAFVGSPASQNSDYRDLNDLDANSSRQPTFKLIALDDENTFKKISAGASFTAGSFNSQFDRAQDQNVVIGGHAVSVDIAPPQQILNGQTFDTEVSFKNVAGVDMDNLKLKLDYPPSFTPTKSNPPSDIGNDTWILGNLRKGEEVKFKISGNLIGPEGARFDSKATIEALLGGELYPISSNSAAISITPAPVALKINLNGGGEYISKTADVLSYTVNYANNTNVSLRDVIIKAKLTGAMFDLNTINSAGAFRSSDNTILWNASNASDLRALSPGQSGSVSFSVHTKSEYPIKRSTDKDFILKVEAMIESPTVPYFVAEGKTINYSDIENKVMGQAQLDARAYFKEPSAGISNKGPIPLRLDQPTQFTIHWLIKNYATDISDVEARGFLGGNIRFTGKVKSNTLTLPIYNERTQEMIWQIPKIAATAGVIGKPIEAVFQVEAVPSTADLNRDMLLIQDSQLTALDDFTGLQLSSKAAGLTTRLPDDPTVNGNGSVLQQQQAEQFQQAQLTERQKLLKLLQQQNASQAEQDQQLQQFDQQYQYDWLALQKQLERQYSQFQQQQEVAQQQDAAAAAANASTVEACLQDAANKRDAEIKAVDENRSDDLRTALEKRRNLLIFAALIGDPHLRHIAIVAAIVGYQKDEQEIQKSWGEGRAKAGMRYQQDAAACNGATGQ